MKLCVESANDKAVAERERDVWIAWHTAFLHRVEIKYFPKLTEMLDKIRPVSRVAAAKKQPDSDTLSRDLMNALMQLPAAAPKPKAPKKTALDASDSPVASVPPTPPASPPAESTP